MIIKDVMDQVAARLDTIAGLRAYAYPAEGGVPPVAVVDFPDDYTYDITGARGGDQLSLPVIVYVARVVDRTTPDLMSLYVDGSGVSSIKRVLESGVDARAYSAFDTVRVERVEFEYVKFADTDCLAGQFTLDIAGRGSE